MKKDIIVVGHKNPDTDSICSAISYAYLKNQISNENYVPMRAGAVNPETAYVLDYFKIDAPNLIEDVRAQIKDTDLLEGIAVKKDIPLRRAWNLLHDEGMATLVVVDHEQKVEGVVSVGDIAKFFTGAQEGCVLTESKTTYENIVETIEGKMVLGNHQECVNKGKVIVATANGSTLKETVEDGDVVVLADKVESQKVSIENGASCLIICLDANVDAEIIELAKKHNCSIIKTKNNSYVTARLLNQSVPIASLMKDGNITMFEETEFVDDVKATVAETRHREFPIVDEAGHFKGVIGRNNLIDVEKKQIIMVDHNERNQAVNGIADATIKEIVDHHKVGHIQTLGPVFYRNMPVGCTSTIIYMMYKENNVEIPQKIAGLMCSAILSDTLLFRSPTCTPMDRKAGEELAKIAGIDPEAYAFDMFGAGSDFGSKTEKEIFNLDYKKFNVGDIAYGVGQVSSVSKKELDALKEKMLAYMETVASSGEVDMVYLMLTDILEESSELLCAGSNALDTAVRAFDVKAGDRSVYLKGAVSRKKQIIPQLTAALQ